MGIPLPMGMNPPGKQRRESLGTPPVPGEESRYCRYRLLEGCMVFDLIFLANRISSSSSRRRRSSRSRSPKDEREKEKDVEKDRGKDRERDRDRDRDRERDKR